MGERLDALGAKHAGAGRPAIPLAGDRSSRPARSWATGARLVRCRCGVVKVKGKRCKECGE
jgi:hypothetical protein